MSAPAVFDQEDESGLVVLLDETPTDADAGHARKIAEHICPSKAVRVTGGSAARRPSGPAGPPPHARGGPAVVPQHVS